MFVRFARIIASASGNERVTMSGDVCPIERQTAKVRSRVTNGTPHLFGDGRSAGARRYRDLLQAFGDEAGGMANLPASAQQLVRRLAQVSVELELQEAQRASGATIDPVAFVTLVNSQRRLLRDLRAIKPKAPTAAALRAKHLAERYGAPQPQEAA
jgi:hypothetical protein